MSLASISDSLAGVALEATDSIPSAPSDLQTAVSSESTSHAKATIHSLAPELLDEIFSYLLSEFLSCPLKSCALVCHFWREPAQRALFAAVDLSSDFSQRAWLASPARVRYPTRHITQSTGGLLSRLDLKVLEACDGLQSLAPGDHNLFYAEQAKGITSATIFRPIAFPRFAEPIPCRLRKLSLHMAVRDNLADGACRAIFIPSLESLNTLRLQSGSSGWTTPFLQDLTEFFSANVFPNLHTLEVHDRYNPAMTDLVHSLPGLKHLIYEQTTFFGTWRHLESVYLRRPRTGLKLEVLTLTTDHTTPTTTQELESLRGIIRVPILATLQRLIVRDVKKEELEGPSGLALLEECEERSIVFECGYGYLWAPYGVFEQVIKLTLFTSRTRDMMD